MKRYGKSRRLKANTDTDDNERSNLDGPFVQEIYFSSTEKCMIDE